MCIEDDIEDDNDGGKHEYFIFLALECTNCEGSWSNWSSWSPCFNVVRDTKRLRIKRRTMLFGPCKPPSMTSFIQEEMCSIKQGK